MNDTKAVGRKIWRYMEFTKFIDMLEQGGLFFIRFDLLSDPWEGFVGLRYKDIDWTAVPDEGKKQLGDVEPHLKRIQAERRYRSMVSCWTKNESESAAMWAQYGKSTEAIAIQSTCRRL